jgi:hypothetical protein
MLAGGVGAAITLTIFLTRGSTVLQLPRSWTGTPQAAQQAAVEEQKPEKAKKPKAAPSTKSRRVYVDPVDGGVTEVTVPLYEEPRLPPVSFPTAGDLPAGMSRSSIKEKYGDPNFVTIQADGGVLLERYIYLNRDRNTTTLVVLENGRTVRAHSVPY